MTLSPSFSKASFILSSPDMDFLRPLSNNFGFSFHSQCSIATWISMSFQSPQRCFYVYLMISNCFKDSFVHFLISNLAILSCKWISRSLAGLTSPFNRSYRSLTNLKASGRRWSAWRTRGGFADCPTFVGSVGDPPKYLWGSECFVWVWGCEGP